MSITWTGTEILEQARYANGSFGDGVTMSADEVADDLIALNMLLASWDVVLYGHTNETKALTASDAEYSWGTGGDINSARPIEMLDMTFIRDGTIDYPLSLIREGEYKLIGDKATTGRPDRVFFDPRFPLAYLYFYPTPDSAYTVYLTSLKGITEITDATAAVSLPQELAVALKWNLAVEIAPNYNVPVTPVMMKRAQETKQVVLNRAFAYKINPVRFDDMTGRSGGRSRSGSILGW